MGCAVHHENGTDERLSRKGLTLILTSSLTVVFPLDGMTPLLFG